MIGKSTCNVAILSIAVKSTQPPDRNECQGIAFGGKLWATRRASTSAILVVQNVKLWMEAWHSFFLWIFVTCYGKVSYFLKNVISQTDLSSSILFLISIDPIRVAYRFQTSYFNFEILFFILYWISDVSNIKWRYSPPCYNPEAVVWIVKPCKLDAVLQRTVCGQN